MPSFENEFSGSQCRKVLQLMGLKAAYFIIPSDIILYTSLPFSTMATNGA